MMTTHDPSIAAPRSDRLGVRRVLGGLVVGALPTLVGMLLYLVSPRYFEPMFGATTAGGVEGQWLVFGLGAGWGALGGVAFARAGRPGRRLLAVLVFTLPALLVMALAPAIVLIVQNLG